MEEIKIASLFSENARIAAKLLENGTLTYKQRSIEGRDVLEIFIKKPGFEKWVTTITPT